MSDEKVTKTAADLSSEQIAEIKSRDLSRRAYAEMFGVSRKVIEAIQQERKYNYSF